MILVKGPEGEGRKGLNRMIRMNRMANPDLGMVSL